MCPDRIAAPEAAAPASFRDRREAGRLLARRLRGHAGRAEVLVLALPRGGVPVAFEVARALDAPLDVCVVRRLAAPGLESLTLGVVAAGGTWALDESVIHELGIPDRTLREVAERELRELRGLEEAYRGGRPAPRIRGRTVILVDDGAATGRTLQLVAAALRRHAPARIVAAIPTAAAAARAEISRSVDEWVGLIEPDPFIAVSLSYDDFSRPGAELVRNLLRFAAQPPVMRSG